MIDTREQITDPIAFVEADPQFRTQLPDASPIFITSPTVDIMVRTQHLSRIRFMSYSYELEACTTLGAAYKHGKANRPQEDIGTMLELAWGPSPAYSNTLVERLGLRPGKDVMRFVHSPYDRHTYDQGAPFLARGEYQLSTGPVEFIHDRDIAHAPGVILATREFTQAVMRVAARYPRRARVHPLGKNFPSAKIVKEFDSTTPHIRDYANYVWTLGDTCDPAALSDEDTLDMAGVKHPRPLLRMSHKINAHHFQARTEMCKIMYDHIQTLRPALEQLQAA